MAEPKWMADLDVASCRTKQGPELAAAWAWWAISQLPLKQRKQAANLWKRGMLPKDMPAENPK